MSLLKDLIDFVVVNFDTIIVMFVIAGPISFVIVKLIEFMCKKEISNLINESKKNQKTIYRT